MWISTLNNMFFSGGSNAPTTLYLGAVQSPPSDGVNAN